MFVGFSGLWVAGFMAIGAITAQSAYPAFSYGIKAVIAGTVALIIKSEAAQKWPESTMQMP